MSGGCLGASRRRLVARTPGQGQAAPPRAGPGGSGRPRAQAPSPLTSRALTQRSADTPACHRARMRLELRIPGTGTCAARPPPQARPSTGTLRLRPTLAAALRNMTLPSKGNYIGSGSREAASQMCLKCESKWYIKTDHKTFAVKSRQDPEFRSETRSPARS
jgi:hypothetical protein